MRLTEASLNAWTVRALPLPELLDEAVRHGFGAVAPWYETIAPYGAERAAALIADSGLALTSVCRVGFFTATDAAGHRRAIDEARRQIDVAAVIGAPTAVMLPGGLPRASRAEAGFVELADARKQASDGIAAVLDHARQAGVMLGLEPLHPMMAADRSVISTLEEANDVITAIDDDQLGLIVDIYHCWHDAHLEREFARAGSKVLGVHLSDWVLPLGNHLSSRGMIGDGCIDLRGVIDMARRHGYTAPFEIEVLSDHWWSQDPVDVIDLIAERFGAL